jgi:putative transcriptional regulator
MTQTLIRWKLSEVMARHRVPAKDLAEFLSISDNAVSNLRKAEVMPRIDGNRLEQICIGISKLSKIGDKVSPYDLLEYIPEDQSEGGYEPQ